MGYVREIACVKVEWVEGKEELSVVCIKVVVKGKEDIRVLRGVVYMMKSRGPRTEPWGTPQAVEEEVWNYDRLLSHLIQKERDDK